ncbi:similar to Saccharomyces cerevisiae YGR098C ESP1 Separase, a caspase-like cysteine protease that promotes sister chromatid separation by mediating dissociation of the cohesin Scc1p from chromatin [Maudiozyma barnettii]|uniref:separase n=1 Tax=Maudiozyma barnettii TaxID=61262 RepID=A0A8H2ZH87_9SACH|nr:separase [Kazachstania barnettii]CAB4251889.1 similar to Saccharomyces cerevisiae YGR098C ESP1 Separase, a caspase-like cysteine protease that promotes sister chromatid separation by mediating dissociation of the cohesin Scc1p from chromatin [Kazachstania barnettii]CAD1778199.1 similar to Saccharomyces cerevisiae YGR098C ESP1 Separase, a caspase-like cysteine protease that promotes sister chromatid separation by mediating dissociation of the cohesin Scc1p from chromatin [Kazachstania barnettii
MSRSDDPLNEMSSNTFFRGSSKSINSFAKPQPSQFIKDLYTSSNIEIGFQIITNFCTNCTTYSKSKMNDIHGVITEVYKILIRIHSITHIKSLVRLHLMIIGKYISDSHYSRASLEIMNLYNTTNIYKSQNFEDILLSDIYKSNHYYISSVKILILQIIIKTKTVSTYETTLIKLFAYDGRFLLRDPKIKIHILNKLLLNLYSSSTHYKILYGLKFLKYMNQYNLKFQDYIKNIDETTFKRQLIAYYRNNQESNHYLNLYYMDYSKYTQSLDKLMLSDIITEEQDTKVHFNNHNDIIKLTKLNKDAYHYIGIEALNVTILQGFAILEKKDIMLCDKLLALTYIWKLMMTQSIVFEEQQKKLYDITLTFLNHNLDKSKPNGNELLEILYNIGINFKQFQRLSNLVNVMFNTAITQNDVSLLLLTVKTELSILNTSLDRPNMTYRSITKKMDKFLQATQIQKYRHEILSKYLNIFAVFGAETFQELQLYCQSCESVIVKRHQNNDLSNIFGISEVMLVFLRLKTDSENENCEKNNILTNMVQSTISGKFIECTGQISAINKFHFLYKYEALIKCVYYFDLSLKNSCTKDIHNIIDTYKKQWFINQNNITTLSELEINFLRTVFSHLIFIQFDKMALGLLELISTNNTYYNELSLDIIQYSLVASYRLGLGLKIDFLKQTVQSLSADFTQMKLDRLLLILDIYLNICLWYNDDQKFTEIFQDNLITTRKEIFDINNTLKLPFNSYISILIFNLKLYNTASTIQANIYALVPSIVESKRAVKLSMSLLKLLSKVNYTTRNVLIQTLTDCYINLMEAHIRIGLSKDTEFYVKEMTKIIDKLKDPSIIFKCLHSLQQYYHVTKQDDLKAITLQEANKIYDHISSEEDIISLTKFLFDNNEYEKLEKSLSLIFGSDLPNTRLLHYWRLKMGKTVVPGTIIPPKLLVLDSINRVDAIYRRILNQLETDPFFKSIYESSLAIPSIKKENGKTTDKKIYQNMNDNIMNSPRSSNMTPKSKSRVQKFDRALVLDNLEKVLNTIESISPFELDHVSLLRITSIYSKCSIILSNLYDNSRNFMTHTLFLSELSRYLPHHYDRILSRLDPKIYQDFCLLPLGSVSHGLLIKNMTSLNEQIRDIKDLDFLFDIITIDICPVTGNLLLSKSNSYDESNIYLTIPLNGSFFRDLDGTRISYIEAVNELNSIIENSNESVSRKVTSCITTSDGRKGWWKNRYMLDKQLEKLLQRIERSWLGGFQGFFSVRKINEVYFAEFSQKFNEILHNNLPSRKHVGTPDAFLQLENWILELFLLMDHLNENFLVMVEDLLYFVLDILVYHGEENAYDEIDMSLLHFQTEEAIMKYHTRCGIGGSKRVQHTFLVVSNKCHLFPWESMAFMKTLSISRVPSLHILKEMLQNNNNKVQLDVHVDRKLSMVLNPGGDLVRSEERFTELFSNIGRNCPESKLLIHEKPSESDLLAMINLSNMFIYIGHGGGEQYARNKEIKRQNKLCPSLLLGCSSAAMKYYGDLEPTGVIYSYLLGGAPLVVGNLWDVTDKDIDKFTMSVFEKIGLIRNITNSSNDGTSVNDAVEESRDVCNLKYLNGTAPVVYGLPAKIIY